MLKYYKVILIVAALLSLNYHSTIAQNVSFEVIDNHAKNTPIELISDKTSLISYLIDPFQSEYEKARVLFKWITHFISFDSVSNSLDNKDILNLELILSNRVACSRGFSFLFSSLASLSGLDVAIIRGTLKDGYLPLSNSRKLNHSWNAIKIDGYWKLIDTTLGSGTINEYGVYQSRFEDFYFLVNPQHLIHSHFPEDPSWQLLNPPVSWNDYNELIAVKPHFFSHHITLDSHNNAIIDLTYDNSITLGIPDNQVVSARLSRNGSELPINQVLVQHQGKKAVIEVNPPQRGIYDLEIFAKKTDTDDDFSKILTYTVKNNRESADSGFPETFGRFLMQRGNVETPITYFVPSNEEILFSLNVPGAVSVSVVNDGVWTDLIKNGDHFSGLVNTKAGIIQVAASFENEQRYSVLLEYMAR